MTLTLGGASEAAMVSRKHTTYATGMSVPGRRGRLRILVSELRPLLPGSYTLRLRNSRRWTARPIRISGM